MEKDKILARLTRLCSMREYCKKDIAAKIERMKGEDAIDTQAIISQLCEDKYIDENRYAAFFARDKSALAGWGGQKIRYALAAKGIDREVIDSALEQIDVAKAQKKMESVLAAKLRTLKGERQEVFAKLVKFGAGRGYSYNQIKAFYDNTGRG
ncbi:MAG: RecX family transcriptional regulator [Bacteroidales bacterium]|nr:RecX family transcriptional regulator [Bacteroidales bacterium]